MVGVGGASPSPGIGDPMARRTIDRAAMNVKALTMMIVVGGV